MPRGFFFSQGGNVQPAFHWLRWWAAAARLVVVTFAVGVHVDDAGAQAAVALADRDDLRHWHVAALQEVFSGVWPAARPPDRPAVVIAVRSGSTLRRWLATPSRASRHTRSAGAFVRGLDRDYLALALDADTGRPFGVLDHEFGHLLVDRHCERLPMWLDEGLAEVIANGLAGRDAADRATAIARLLRLEPLMPLRDLLQASRREDVDSRDTALFYAQAWTFVHYLLVADAGARAPRLATFMSQLMRGVGDLDAAISAFGDLASVEAAWTRYVRTAAFAYIRPPLPRLRPTRLTARPLAPRHAALLAGDFMAHAGNTEAAYWQEGFSGDNGS
jgi:hypothetical protein